MCAASCQTAEARHDASASRGCHESVEPFRFESADHGCAHHDDATIARRQAAGSRLFTQAASMVLVHLQPQLARRGTFSASPPGPFHSATFNAEHLPLRI